MEDRDKIFGIMTGFCRSEKYRSHIVICRSRQSLLTDTRTDTRALESDSGHALGLPSPVSTIFTLPLVSTMLPQCAVGRDYEETASTSHKHGLFPKINSCLNFIFYLILGLPIGCFQRCFSTNILYAPLSDPSQAQATSLPTSGDTCNHQAARRVHVTLTAQPS
jgi:hypothetical protein